MDEQSFGLTKTEFNKIAFSTFTSLGLAIPFIWYLTKVNLFTLFSICSLPVAISLGMLLYIKQFKYIYISSSGMRGRGKFGYEWQVFSWVESLEAKSSVIGGLRGVIFKSLASDRKMFVPNCILESNEFKSEVSKLVSKSHPLLSQANRGNN